jgi:D-glycero-alpha-D-manno-heptose-7-phosphate kinase
MIITRTPFRISLFGGGSDHPNWFLENGGNVLSFTIDKYCYLTTRILPPFFEHKYRVAYSVVETEKTFEALKHPVVRESIRKYAPSLGLEIHHDGDLPARSGVGSSSAFAVGMIHALLELGGISPTPTELANLAIDMEHKILKENVGWQDQIACALGGMNYIQFSPEGSWKAKRVSLSSNYADQLKSRMALVFTGISRSSSEVSSSLLANLKTNSSTMSTIMEMARISLKYLESESGLDDMGELLDESWKAKRAMNPAATSDELDSFYDLAKKAGAQGGKLLGAGGGGFFLFWLKEDGAADFQSNFSLGTKVPFNFSSLGSKVLFRSISGSEESFL